MSKFREKGQIQWLGSKFHGPWKTVGSIHYHINCDKYKAEKTTKQATSQTFAAALVSANLALKSNSIVGVVSTDFASEPDFSSLITS